MFHTPNRTEGAPLMTCDEFAHFTGRRVRIATTNGGEGSYRFEGVGTSSYTFRTGGGHPFEVEADRLALMADDGPGVRLRPEPPATGPDPDDLEAVTIGRAVESAEFNADLYSGLSARAAERGDLEAAAEFAAVSEQYQRAADRMARA